MPGFSAALALPSGLADGSDVSFRQLRHHTKNALQTILDIVGHAPELRGTRDGESLSDHLQQRILLAAQLSDTLFGLTAPPGTFEQRLTALCEGVVRLLGDRDADVTVFVAVTECPAEYEATVLRVANELVGNAVKHGMHARLLGRIDVAVRVKRGKLVLSVSDDGWGCGSEPARPGEGLMLASALARRHNGVVRLRELRRRTMATLEIDMSPQSGTRECGVRELEA